MCAALRRCARCPNLAELRALLDPSAQFADLVIRKRRSLGRHFDVRVEAGHKAKELAFTGFLAGDDHGSGITALHRGFGVVEPQTAAGLFIRVAFPTRAFQYWP